MKKPLWVVVGGVVAVLGLLFTLQGTDVIGGSAMSGTTFWAIAGPVILVIGLIVVVLGVRGGATDRLELRALEILTELSKGSNILSDPCSWERVAKTARIRGLGCQMIREVTAHDQIPSQEGYARHRRACRRRRAAPGGRGGDAFRRTWRERATAGPRGVSTKAGAAVTTKTSAASISTPATVTAGASPSLGPAGDAAAKPYMGWSSYSMQVYSNDGGNWISADQIIAQSDAMHQKLQPYGYKYINIDAAWNGGTDEYGRPVPSKKLFPNGLQAVIDHIHANGQKVGLYSIPGISKGMMDAAYPIYGHPGCTTANLAKQPLQQGDYWGFGYRMDMANPCAQAYIDSIADLFASWGVDFLKFDSVTPGLGSQRPVDGCARGGQGLVAGARPAQDLARALLGPRHQLRGLLEVGRERLAGRVGRRVLLPG